MTRPSILSCMADRPGWRCWRDPSRNYRPSIPEIKRPNFITRSQYEEQWNTIEKWTSFYAKQDQSELDSRTGINPDFKLETITKRIFSKLRTRKRISRSCPHLPACQIDVDQAPPTADHPHTITHDIITDNTSPRNSHHHQAFMDTEGFVIVFD